MRRYKTNSFHSNHTNTNRSGILYYVLDDSERTRIHDTHIALLQIYKETMPIAKWNKNDNEALTQILTWPRTVLEGGKHADLSEDQCDKIEKMLRKLLNDKQVSFFDVFKLQLTSLTNMTDREMRQEMDNRRNLSKTSTASTLPLLFDFTALK